VAQNNGGPRVLVVDDVAEMRTAIRRLLATHGYQVDVASTLAEARSLGPAGYDALIVDAHLGADRGLDLIEALRAEDPAAAQRCLMITGGSSHTLPAGIPHLVKPFRPGQLLAAVQGLSRRGTGHAEGGQAEGTIQHQSLPMPAPRPGTLPTGSAAQPHGHPAPHLSPAMLASPEPKPATVPAQGAFPASAGGVPAPTARGAFPGPAGDVRATSAGGAFPGPAGDVRATSAAGVFPASAGDAAATRGTSEAIAAWRLLALARRRRMREGGVLSDFIHDGLIQQLAAASLALHIVRRQVPASLGERLDEGLRALNAAGRSVRLLVDKCEAPVPRPSESAAMLRNQTAWLLAEPLSLDVPEVERLGPLDVGLIADALELMLLAAVPVDMAATAHAALAASDAQIEIRLTVRPGPGGTPGAGAPSGFRTNPPTAGVAGDPAAVRAAFTELAGALGTDVQAEFASGEWRARIVVPRQVPSLRRGPGFGQHSHPDPAQRTHPAAMARCQHTCGLVSDNRPRRGPGIHTAVL
jgi:CheY-like chemotaxis protein